MKITNEDLFGIGLVIGFMIFVVMTYIDMSLKQNREAEEICRQTEISHNSEIQQQFEKYVNEDIK